MKPSTESVLALTLAAAPFMAPATGVDGYTLHSRSGECLGHRTTFEDALAAQRRNEESAFVRRAADGVIMAAKPRRRRRGGE